MKLEEKIKQEFKNYLPIKDLSSDPAEAWGNGFYTGFLKGYVLACKEAVKGLNQILEKLRQKGE